MIDDENVRAVRAADSVFNKKLLAAALAALGMLVSLGVGLIRGDNSDMKQTIHNNSSEVKEALKDVINNQQKTQLDSAAIKSDVRNLYTRLDDEVIKQMQAQALMITSNRVERMQQIDVLTARVKAVEEVQAGHRSMK